MSFAENVGSQSKSNCRPTSVKGSSSSARSRDSECEPASPRGANVPDPSVDLTAGDLRKRRSSAGARGLRSSFRRRLPRTGSFCWSCAKPRRQATTEKTERMPNVASTTQDGKLWLTLNVQQVHVAVCLLACICARSRGLWESKADFARCLPFFTRSKRDPCVTQW